MGKHHDKPIPGESEAYRQARDELLTAEIELRRQTEAVAQMRRELPAGGKLPQHYVFDDVSGGQVSFSELFAEGKDSLIVYSFMYGLDWDNPCPACTSLADGFNGFNHHVTAKVNFAVVAKAGKDKLAALAQQRGWDNFRFLSSLNNSYNEDYHAGSADGSEQLPLINVFVRRQDGIYHHWASELLWATCDPGQQTRHVDPIWPLWNLFDLTPEGREDFGPKLEY